MLTNNALQALAMILASSFIWNHTLASSADSANGLDKVPAFNEPILPIARLIDTDPEKVALGELLFNDKHLSKNNQVACADCHQLQKGGDDDMPVGITHDGIPHKINTPTIFNAALNYRQNWDGRANSLEDQIDMVIHSEIEGKTNWPELLDDTTRQIDLKNRFTQLYPDGITRENYLDALTEFEKTLITPNSRFDQFLLGDINAINKEEKAGYLLFKEYGCVSCHQGINIGGNLYQKFGIFYDYIRARGNITDADHGRKNITGKASDDYVFKVPTLRNIEVTAPYLHDGQAETLAEAIQIMGTTQLGRELSSKDITLIEAFLRTLTGQYKGKYLNEFNISEAK